MKRLSGNSYILIVVMAATLAFIGTTLQLVYIASKVLPLVIGGAVFVLASVQLWREISAKGGAEKTVAEDKTSIGKETKVEGRRYLPSLAWLVGFAFAIYLVGFVTAILLFVLSYMKLHGSRWLMAIITAIVFTGIVYLVFDLALRLNLYPGLLFK